MYLFTHQRISSVFIFYLLCLATSWAEAQLLRQQAPVDDDKVIAKDSSQRWLEGQLDHFSVVASNLRAWFSGFSSATVDVEGKSPCPTPPPPCAPPPTPAPTPSPSAIQIQWKLGSAGTSCSEVCGGSCNPTAQNKVDSVATISYVAGRIGGISCSSYEAAITGLSNEPSVVGGSICSYQLVGSDCFTATVSYNDMPVQRICCCGTDEECPVS